MPPLLSKRCYWCRLRVACNLTVSHETIWHSFFPSAILSWPLEFFNAHRISEKWQDSVPPSLYPGFESNIAFLFELHNGRRHWGHFRVAP